MRPILRYPGSKARLAQRIVELMPEHDAYLEPFLGSGIVLLNKPRVSTETVNDLDGRLVNFFTVLRDRPDDLAAALALTPYARMELERSGPIDDDEMEDARRFAVECWMSREGTPRGPLHFRYDLNGRALAATWARLPSRIPSAAERLRGVTLENRDALALIQEAQPGTLIYADPPYITQDLYRHGMTLAQHRLMVMALNDHEGPVVLSSRKFYIDLMEGWERHDFDAKNVKNGRYREVVWVKN